MPARASGGPSHSLQALAVRPRADELQPSSPRGQYEPGGLRHGHFQPSLRDILTWCRVFSLPSSTGVPHANTVRTGTFVNPHMSLPRSATPLRVLRKHASRRRLLLRMECCSRRSVRFHVAAGAVLVDAGLYERVQVTRLASRATPSRKVCGEQLERFVKRLDSRHYTGHPASTQLIRTIN